MSCPFLWSSRQFSLTNAKPPTSAHMVTPALCLPLWLFALSALHTPKTDLPILGMFGGISVEEDPIGAVFRCWC